MRRAFAFIGFLIFYVNDIVRSNLRVAYDVLTPTHLMKPGVIALDVSEMTDRQILLMANFITMTPGTLGLAVSENRSTLYIHAMYIDVSAEALEADLMERYGKRVRHVF
jgi:multicomponent Na+:H+ antiporter subunit E